MNYDELKNKYDLPSMDEIDFEFEIDKEADYILREIRRKINSKINAYMDLIHGVLQPDASEILQMHEVGFFTEREKSKLLKLYKRLMKISRHSDELAISFDEESEAIFIKEVYTQWPEIKEKILTMVRKMKDSWDKELEEDNNMLYMG
ncbi:hypothetical protein KY334_02260 [Candidatus Woesearchaeota archaeon]|nr:hypothetical protein [Candidatus Woesearchaeota archaeon]